MTNQHIFIWAPYQGQPGKKHIIDYPHAGSLQEAINISLENRERWRKQYGEGQVIVATVSSYIGLH